jgi:1,4-alpha-glucan branching enzyme
MLKRKIKFELSAPEAKEVSLVGNFNQWNIQANPMKKDKIRNVEGNSLP